MILYSYEWHPSVNYEAKILSIIHKEVHWCLSENHIAFVGIDTENAGLQERLQAKGKGSKKYETIHYKN